MSDTARAQLEERVRLCDSTVRAAIDERHKTAAKGQDREGWRAEEADLAVFTALDKARQARRDLALYDAIYGQRPPSTCVCSAPQTVDDTADTPAISCSGKGVTLALVLLFLGIVGVKYLCSLYGF